MSKEIMPAIFIGHGSPMNAIENNSFTKSWRDIASKISKPKAILCISAHWLLEETAVLSVNNPKMIYDFYGFPKELYEVVYPAKSNSEYSKMVKEVIKSVDVKLDDSWGLDHGAWSVLVKMYPKADIPVIQLSINMNLSLQKHLEIGKELAILRERGFLILGSGNIVHNLGVINFNASPYPWAIDFNEYVMKSLRDRKADNLINFEKEKSSIMAVPTTDHYIPLIYVFGASRVEEKPNFFCEKIVMGSISMTGVVYGL